MSNAETQVSSNDAEVVESQRLTGIVKWFNNRAGFGFVTVLSGDRKEEDVFAHHSGITVDSEQYKYLVQGEYVTFDLRKSDNEEHPYQAGNIRGVETGPLMCETRLAMRKSSQEGEGEGENSRPQRRRPQQRPRGTGPRDERQRVPRDSRQQGNWQMDRGNRRQPRNAQQEQ